MTSSGSKASWVTNHLANPVLRPLLRGPFGRRFGQRLAVLRYKGRRTGRVRELVVQYVREGDSVWIMAGQPDRKRWWRNMTAPAGVELWLAGQHTSGTALVLGQGDHDPDVSKALQIYQRAFSTVTSSPGSAVMIRVVIAHRDA